MKYSNKSPKFTKCKENGTGIDGGGEGGVYDT